jgi:hypothetical protein
MKKVFSLLVILAVFSVSASAQSYLLPKGGITFSNLNVNNDAVEGRTGFVAGLGLGIPLTPDNFFVIQPEVLYIQKGANFAANQNQTFVGQTTLNYLEVPVLGKINFGGEAFRLFVNAGPSVAYSLGGTTNNGEANIAFGDDATATLNNRLDFGAQFGGGFGFRAGPGDILLELRYGLGLSNILNTQIAGADTEAQNRVFALMLNYAIPLGSRTTTRY